MNKSHVLQRIFTKKITILALSAILIYVMVAIIGSILEYRSYQEKLSQHRANIDQLSQDNLQLNDLLSFLNTDDAVDAYARTRLGLQNEGERAFIITEGSLEATRVNDLTVPLESGAHKWLRYYFD